MVETKQGNVIGIVDIIDFSPAHKRAEIGIVIKQEHRHKGYATEVLRLIKDYALNILHRRQL